MYIYAAVHTRARSSAQALSPLLLQAPVRIGDLIEVEIFFAQGRLRPLDDVKLSPTLSVFLSETMLRSRVIFWIQSSWVWEGRRLKERVITLAYWVRGVSSELLLCAIGVTGVKRRVFFFFFLLLNLGGQILPLVTRSRSVFTSRNRCNHSQPDYLSNLYKL
jgi:hypothetical protein